MEIIQRRGNDGRRQQVENHSVDIRVSFDQSKHVHPLNSRVRSAGGTAT
jgi:hypothetical protein